MKTRELRQLLARKDYVEVRQSASHLIVRCGMCQTAVPVHSGDIPLGTLRGIERILAPCLGEGWLR